MGARDRLEVHTLKTEGCDFVRGPSHVDVEGTRVAFGGEICVPPCPPCWRLAIDDVADSKPPRTLVRSLDGFNDIRLAGNFAAASTWKRAVVYDLEKGRVSYRPRLPSRVEGLLEIDLQADGKLVMASSFPETEVAWFSPDDPRAHVMPICVRPSYPDEISIRLADDHVAFEREVSNDTSELVVADLRGNVRRVASFDRLHRRVGDFDFDGKRLTWASQRILAAKDECAEYSRFRQRDCARRSLGPTTIYVARLE